MTITQSVTLQDGRDAHQITLSAHGMTAKIVTLGAALQDVRMEGHDAPLILGFKDLAAYADNSVCMGAIAGRFANRIGDAAISIDGQDYTLDANWLGKHALHGGRDGLQYWNWKLVESGADRAVLEVTLPDGHMGYPGNLTIRCIYQILPGNVIDVHLSATTDKPTVCGLASHCYFNLDGRASIDQHLLHVPCPKTLAYDADAIPTGEIVDVAGTHRDFTEPRPIDNGLVDGNYCLSGGIQPLRDVATLTSTASQRSLTIATNQPGLQIYNAPEFAPAAPGLSGQAYGNYAGLAIEPQNWPNAPKFSHFPEAILRPGETYVNHSQFKFS